MAGDSCTKGTFIVMNIIIGSVGLILIGTSVYVGFWVEVEMTSSFESLKSMLSFGINGNNDLKNTDEKQLNSLLRPVWIVLLAIGVFLLLLVIISIVGTWYRCTTIQWLSVTFLILLVLTQLVLVIVFFNELYSCCGVTGYLDFGAAENWSRTSVIHPKNNRVVVYLKIPFSCCKPDATDYNCASVGNTKSDYYKTGCYEKIMLEIEVWKTTLYPYIVVMLLAQVLCVSGHIIKTTHLVNNGIYDKRL
ncbi:hypothetical protein LSH36_1999g00005 [Paralvinella palmiformis]|uniref:Tetraspanin n=1 Tax=Paralvinella palmiformis TaxID=53620 RepID=A0AAD9ISB9_9ANNE|nr:hypothetical protein LSH36_1999g00005 [Paralvinella palmiformis]